ncbi:hypothetical protein H257_05845, partial [Aphanomyces astaci]
MAPSWVLLVAAVATVLLHSVYASSNAAVLYPNQLQTHQVIYPNQPVVYELRTDADVSYEVKLSYRATTPSKFTLRILDSTEGLHKDRAQYKNMRRILNTEKTFVRGIADKISYVQVSMQVEGISYLLTQAEMDARRTEFDILLEDVVLQVLPRSAIPLIVVAVILLLLMFVCVYPRVMQLLSPDNVIMKSH